MNSSLSHRQQKSPDTDGDVSVMEEGLIHLNTFKYVVVRSIFTHTHTHTHTQTHTHIQLINSVVAYDHDNVKLNHITY